VAVDDLEMGVTDVVRGDDHLSNTPKQLLVLAGLGAEPPRYAHLPLLHGPDGKKLSKRHRAASVQELRDEGYLPEAVRNYLALLGWGADDDATVLSTGELLERFEISRVGRASAIFDERKLRWLDGRHLRALDPGEYERRLGDFLRATDGEAAKAFDGAEAAQRELACRSVGDKAQTLAEAWTLVRFLFGTPEPDERAWRKVMKPEAAGPLEAARAALAEVDSWSADAIEAALSDVLSRLDLKPNSLYQPIRVAITGTSISPGIFDSLHALGPERSLARIDAAIERLHQG
jgi:glutamyl-tRNA synthetase